MPTGTPLSAATATTTSNASSQALTIPATASAGDMAYLITAESTGANTCPAPTGWTLVTPPAGSSNPQDDGLNSMRTYLFSKKLVAGDLGASVTVQWTGSGRLVTGLVVVPGGASQDNIIAWLDSTADLLLTVPAITPVAADCVQIGIITDRYAASGATGVTTNAAWTELQDINTTNTTNPRLGVWMAYRQLSGQAGVAQPTYDNNYASAARNNGWVLTIAPAATTQTAAPATRASTQVAGSPSVIATGNASVAPNTRAAASVANQPTMAVTADVIAPATRVSALALGAVTVAPTEVSVAPNTRAATSAVGAISIAPTEVSISPSTRAAASTAGQPTLSAADSPTITPLTRAAASVVGAVAVDPFGEVAVLPVTRSSGLSVGTLTLAASGDVAVTPSGRSSTLTLGSVALQGVGDAEVTPSTRPSITAAGSPGLSAVGDASITPDSRLAESVAGQPIVSPVGEMMVAPAERGSALQIGLLTLDAVGDAVVFPAGRDSMLLVGSPAVTTPSLFNPSSRPSASVLSAPILSPVGDVMVTANTRESALALGVVALDGTGTVTVEPGSRGSASVAGQPNLWPVQGPEEFEMDAYREVTRNYIATDPSTVLFMRPNYVADGAGGRVRSGLLPVGDPQTVMFVTPAPNASDSQTNVDGREVTATLGIVAEYDADIAVGDEFQVDGVWHKITYIAEDMRYEKLAEAVVHNG